MNYNSRGHNKLFHCSSQLKIPPRHTAPQQTNQSVNLYWMMAPMRLMHRLHIWCKHTTADVGNKVRLAFRVLHVLDPIGHSIESQMNEYLQKCLMPERERIEETSMSKKTHLLQVDHPPPLFKWLAAVAVGKGHREDAAILTTMWKPHSADRERRCLPTFFRLCTLCKNRALMKALSKIFIDIIIMWFCGFMCIWNIYKVPELLS